MGLLALEVNICRARPQIGDVAVNCAVTRPLPPGHELPQTRACPALALIWPKATVLLSGSWS
jgi:hypothetical protein